MYNEIFGTLLSSLITLSVGMVAGYLGRKMKIMTDAVNAGLSGVLIKIALPCMIFVSFMQPFSQELLLESLTTLVIFVVVFTGCCGVGLLLARTFGANEDDRAIWGFSLAFPNVGYMGIPVIFVVYGATGLIYTTMAVVAFNLVTFSLGVYLFVRGNINIRSMFISVPLVASYLGFVFFVTGWRLPGDLEQGIRLVGDLSVPLAMMLVGALLAKSNIRTLFSDFSILPIIAARLVGIPLATFFILRLFLTNDFMLEVIVILMAMPVAANTAIFAEQYKGNTDLASKVVTLSNILCIISIPLIALIF
ncbi:MAG: AEC family transporter [Turicibacter sp.]|nr:AEC family transporter [Turicibacter sp.]